MAKVQTNIAGRVKSFMVFVYVFFSTLCAVMGVL